MYNKPPSHPPSPESHTAPTLFHPKPIRPAFGSSYSTPLMTTAGTSPPFAAGPSSASSSPSPPHIPGNLKPSHSLSAKNRKATKKGSSTPGKHKSVQTSLEVKVERSRGFHAFFVPLARSMPPAPPSSPVFGQSANAHHPASGEDTEWSTQPKSACEERWVENVQRMDLD